MSIVAPVAVGAVSAHNCGTAADDRSCFDKSDQMIYIFNANGSLFGSMSAQSPCFGPSIGSYTNSIWATSGAQSTKVSTTSTYTIPCTGGLGSGPFETRDFGSPGANAIVVPGSANHDWLEWFANCCSSHQFQVVN